jgi:acyl carrier protein
LRDWLRSRLPASMIPSSFVVLAALPLTPNGKVDRRALPAPEAPPPPAADSFVPPGTDVEEMLAAIWREVLDRPRIGIYDDFFALGGHSFQAAQVLSRVGQAFGAKLPLRVLLDTPTVAGLAVAVAEELLRQAHPETIARVLAEMDGVEAQSP